MTREETKRLLHTLEEYYDKKIAANQQAFNVWASLLAPYDWQEIQKAALSYMRENRFAPLVSDILDALAKTREASGDDYAQSLQRIRAAIRKFGSYREDEAMAALSTIDRDLVERWGGWQTVCASDFSNTTMRAQYRDLYNALMARHMTEAQLPLYERPALEGTA